MLKLHVLPVWLIKLYRAFAVLVRAFKLAVVGCRRRGILSSGGSSGNRSGAGVSGTVTARFGVCISVDLCDSPYVQILAVIQVLALKP